MQFELTMDLVQPVLELFSVLLYKRGGCVVDVCDSTFVGEVAKFSIAARALALLGFFLERCARKGVSQLYRSLSIRHEIF